MPVMKVHREQSDFEVELVFSLEFETLLLVAILGWWVKCALVNVPPTDDITFAAILEIDEFLVGLRFMWNVMNALRLLFPF